MRLLNCQVTNFGSYRDLTFSFSALGLSLVHGITGSGKSTLQDIPSWILYGVTAKDGAVDEVRSWKSADEATIGILNLEVNNKVIAVTRIRGKANENDLYWQEGGSDFKHRGKDLQDTQKLLNKYLGVDADFYCASSYFNEFSNSGLFFLAKAKDKRQLFEKLTCLDFPIALSEKITNEKRVIKKSIEDIVKVHSKALGKLEQLLDTKTNLEKHSIDWEAAKAGIIEDLTNRSKFFTKEKESKIQALKTKSYRFDEDKNAEVAKLVDKLDDLDQKMVPFDKLEEQIQVLEIKLEATAPVCPTCNRPNSSDERLDALKEKKKRNDQYIEKFNDYSTKLREVQDRKNPYLEQIDYHEKAGNHYEPQLAVQRKQVNPFIAQLAKIELDVNKVETALLTADNELKAFEHKYNSLVQLNDLSLELRSVLLKNVVKEIENSTNSYLEKYFDSEFIVSFDLSGSDSLDVGIQKNGYSCVYKQLSKGQRQLLRLSFSVAVMKAAANNIGVHFNALFFDEALDGLDPTLKVKAFNLFSDLEKDHETILVIDHTPEFQSMFNKKFQVSMTADESSINEE